MQKRKYTVLGAGVLLLAFMVWLLTISTPSGLLVTLPTLLGYKENKYLNYLILGGTELLLVVPLIVYMAVTRTSLRALMGNRTSVRQNLLAALLGVLLVPAVSGLDTLMTELFKLFGATILDTSSMILPDTVGQMFAGFVAVGITAGLVEEPIFRGVMLRGVGSAQGKRIAILLTAVTFSLIHLDLVGAPSRFVAGLVLGMLAWRAGALLPGMITHAVYNSTTVALSLLFSKALPNWNGFGLSTNASVDSVLTWVILSVPFIAASWFVYKQFGRATPPTAAWKAQPYAAAEVKNVHALPWVALGIIVGVMIAANTVLMWLPKDLLNQVNQFVK